MSEGLTHRQRTAGMLRAIPSSQLWNREHISNTRQTEQVLMHVCIHVYLHIHIYIYACMHVQRGHIFERWQQDGIYGKIWRKERKGRNGIIIC